MVVSSDTPPKGPTFTLKLHTISKAARQSIETMLAANQPLLYRDLFGRGLYVSVVNQVVWQQILAAPAAGETTSVRDLHMADIDVATVDRPPVGPTSDGALAVMTDYLAQTWDGAPQFNNDSASVLI